MSRRIEEKESQRAVTLGGRITGQGGFGMSMGLTISWSPSVSPVDKQAQIPAASTVPYGVLWAIAARYSWRLRGRTRAMTIREYCVSVDRQSAATTPPQ